MPPRKTKQAAGSNKEPAKKRTCGYKLPDPIEPGEILVDMTKKKWRIGKSIGQGGFGEIYLASDNIDKNVDETTANNVVKIEPHSNGPLFAEMHCYMRIGKPELIDAWTKEKKLKSFGMPKFMGSGSLVYKGQKYRFMVIERFGSDLQKILNNHNKKLSFKTVYQAGIQILDVLEYIHSREYIHADIKASNLLLGHHPNSADQLFLVDYGLACRYANDGVHKEYRYDVRKAHNGTIEFTSRDAHIGAHSRRGDLEILGYNLVQWLCSKLPWEDNLQDCNYVTTQKREFMEDLDMFISKCFPDEEPPKLKKYLEYVVSLTFDDKPDYEHCRNILREGLKARGYKDDGKMVFLGATPKPASRKPKSKITNRKVSKRKSADAFSDDDEDLQNEVSQVIEETKSSNERKRGKLNAGKEKENAKTRANKKKNTRSVPLSDLTGLDNPTDLMLKQMAKTGKTKPKL